jgi:DNA invertase Pin-like site-specific DNA recombinase
MQTDTHSDCEFIRAVQYLRMSSDLQFDSLANQAAAIAEYAERRGYTIIRSYVDEGKSGLSLRGRDGLRDLLADAFGAGRDFSAILIYDVSRWGRFQDPDQAAHYEYLCRQAGVAVHYCAEPFNNDFTPMAGIWKNLKRVMAHEYSRDLSERVARAKLQQAQLGFNQGGSIIYGFRRQLCDEAGNPRLLLKPGQTKGSRTDRVHLVPGPNEELQVIRTIFNLYTEEKLSLENTARHLREQGIPGKNGRPWTSSTVRALLVSELCVGRYVYNRTSGLLQAPSRKKNPAHLLTSANLAIQPPVSEKLFEAAQACLSERRWLKLDREKLLGDLRALWLEKGRLSTTLIDDSPSTASVATYAKHFGCIKEAYSQIAYVPPLCIGKSGRAWSREELCHQLKALYEHEGRLSHNLIRRCPDLPSANLVKKKIGSMVQIYKFIGVPQPPRDRSKMTVRSRPIMTFFSKSYIIERLQALLAEHGKISGPLIRKDPTLPSDSTIINRFGTLVAAYHAAGWSIDRRAIWAANIRRASEVLRASHRA